MFVDHSSRVFFCERVPFAPSPLALCKLVGGLPYIQHTFVTDMHSLVKFAWKRFLESEVNYKIYLDTRYNKICN